LDCIDGFDLGSTAIPYLLRLGGKVDWFSRQVETDLASGVIVQRLRRNGKQLGYSVIFPAISMQLVHKNWAFGVNSPLPFGGLPAKAACNSALLE
jgi:hypothetical protein